MCSVALDGRVEEPVEFGVGSIPTERLEKEISELAAHISAATCRWLCLVAEFERREGYLGWGFHCCAAWLAWRCSISPDTAREQVRVARALGGLELVRREFGAGRLSYSKVRALTRVATVENQEYLLMIARHGTAAQLERLCRSYRRVLDVAVERANDSHARRQLSCSWDDDGSLVFRGRLPAEDGAMLLQALEAARETLNRDARGLARNGAENGGDERDAATDAPTPFGYSDLSAEPSAEAERPDERPARDADALVLLAESALSGEHLPLTGAERCQLVVHVDAEALVDDAAEGRCEIDDGPALPAETARRLGCDGTLIRIIEKDGRPLSVGRKTRTISPALRRALNARDQGRCRFPGCSRKHADAHHIRHWAHGGETKLSNLALLCRRHHRLVHEAGYGMEVHGNSLRFTRPDGHVIAAAPRQRGGHHDRVRAFNRRRGVRIDHESITPLSGGDRMDHGMAVEGLLTADGLIKPPSTQPAATQPAASEPPAAQPAQLPP